MSAKKFDLWHPKKYANVRVEHSLSSKNDRVIAVRLHDTIVVAFNARTGEIVLNSGGWHTPTTRTAIYTALTQLQVGTDIRISTFKGKWLITVRDYAGNPFNIPWVDGIAFRRASENGNHVLDLIGPMPLGVENWVTV